MSIARMKAFPFKPTLFDRISKSTNPKLSRQIRLLKECARTCKDLDAVLQAQGLTYDDLRYEFDERLKNTSGLYRRLSDFEVKEHDLPAISFFSGAGGADLGFEAAGFEHLALVEINRIFCDTIRLNR